MGGVLDNIRTEEGQVLFKKLARISELKGKKII